MKKSFFVFPIIILSIIFTTTSGTVSATPLSIVEQSEDGIKFNFTLPLPEIVNLEGTNFKKLKAEGCVVIGQPGAPGVLVKGALIAIPPACDVTVKAIVLESTPIANFLLAPSPERILIEEKSIQKKVEEQFRPDEKLYATEGFYPDKLAEVEFTGYLRDRRVVKINIYPVKYNPVLKTLILLKKIRVNVRYNNNDQIMGEINDVPQSENGLGRYTPFEKVYESCLLNHNQFRFNRLIKLLKENVSSTTTLASEIKESPFAVKVVIEQEGIYKINYDDLHALGINLSTATNENLKMVNRGQEIAVYCSGTGQFVSGDYILFYGEFYKSLYTRKNVYWVYQGERDGKRMVDIDASPDKGHPEQHVFRNRYYAEEDNMHSQHLPPHEEGADHWFWEDLSIIEEPLSKDFSVNLQNINKSTENFSITINLRAKTNPSQHPNHHTRIHVNGNMVGDFVWDSEDCQYNLTQTIDDISPMFFQEGENVITVEAVDDLGLTVDRYFINWFAIDYWDTLVAEENYLIFYGGETAGIKFQIEGFTSNNLWLFDITDSVNVKRLSNATITQSGLTHTLTFEDDVAGDKIYCALSPDSFSLPSELIVDETSDLSAKRDNVDYIIITHESFYNGIQELKDYRKSKGVNIEVVKLQDVYDEFSHGLKNVKGIKDFLSYAYSHWHQTDHPTYVLLVGDASVDYRDDYGYYKDGKEDLLPTALYQTTSLGDTPTDNWFVCVNGEDYLADMFVGRICVKTEQDLQNVIEKIKKYEGKDLAPWSVNVILAADNAPLFENISNTLEAVLPEGYYAKKIYINDFEDTSYATDDLINNIDEGAVLTNFTGHGHVSEWASPYLFHTPDFRGSERNDVEKLSNGDKLTFVSVLNCMSGYFPGWEVDYSIAEEFVRAKNKGAIACVASTSAGYPSEHQVLAKKIFEEFFNNGNKIVGSLVTAAKIDAYSEVFSRDIVETFTLFGDPSTELKLIDSSAYESFEPVSPDNNTILPKMPIGTFTWGQWLYERFKIQYSTDVDFSPETTLTVPLMPFVFISTNQYTPNIFIWSLLRMMSFQSETIYWRIVAYDEDFKPIAYSNSRSFLIEK